MGAFFENMEKKRAEHRNIYSDACDELQYMRLARKEVRLKKVLCKNVD